MFLTAYADLVELKKRIGEEGTDRDGDLTSFLISASSAINDFTGREFGPGTRTEYGWCSSRPFIMPKAEPIASVVQLKIEGTVVPARIEMGRKAVARADMGLIDGDWELTYIVSEEVPRAVMEAALMTAQAMADAPAFDHNMTTASIGGVVQGAFQQSGAGYIPQGAQSLLRPLVRVFQA